MVKKIKLLLVLLTLFVSQITLAETQKFVSVSDIHFNPFVNCTTFTFKTCPQIIKLQKAPITEWADILDQYDNEVIAGYGHDTNYALLKSSLNEIKAISDKEHISFAVFLGDFLAHGFHAQYILYTHDRSTTAYCDFVAKTLAFITLQIKTTLSNISIFAVVGNNDSYTGDYRVVPHGKFLKDASVLWASLIKNEDDKKTFQHDFANGGYYTAMIGKNKIIVLNSVLFSRFANKDIEKAGASQQLVWLDRELSQATKQNQKVILALHIPLGVDIKSSLRIFFSKVKEFWLPEYTQRFHEILQQYPTTVTAIFPGHVHRDVIHVLGFKMPNNVPVNFTPSISPIFGNNPSFKIFSLDTKTLKFMGFDEYDVPIGRSTSVWEKEVSLSSKKLIAVN